MKNLDFILEFPQMVISLFFLTMSMIGLSVVLSDEGIDPLAMQVAGILLMVIMVLKLVLKAVDYTKNNS